MATHYANVLKSDLCLAGPDWNFISLGLGMPPSLVKGCVVNLQLLNLYDEE
jgi:hypothetical protein